MHSSIIKYCFYKICVNQNYLDYESQRVFVWQLGFLAEPETVVNGKGVDGGCKMLSVDLSKLFSPTVVFVINIHHLVRHLSRPNSMDFKHLQKQYKSKRN